MKSVPRDRDLSAAGDRKKLYAESSGLRARQTQRVVLRRTWWKRHFELLRGDPPCPGGM
jgi:hypothetical protein